MALEKYEFAALPARKRPERESIHVSFRCVYSTAGTRRDGGRLDLVPMPFGIVLVGLTIFLVARRLVRAIAERLVFGETTHADPDGFLLWFDFDRSLVGFNNLAHLF